MLNPGFHTDAIERMTVKPNRAGLRSVGQRQREVGQLASACCAIKVSKRYPTGANGFHLTAEKFGCDQEAQKFARLFKRPGAAADFLCG